MTMIYSYYPGCSLERSAAAYHKSTLAIAKILGLTLKEIEDWNCCGAMEYFAVDALPAYALVARNLALAANMGQNGRILTAPCSACFLNLHKVDRYMQMSPQLNKQVNQALAAGGLHYEPGSVQVDHLLEIVVQAVGYKSIQQNVVRPLYELKVAPYYGCLTVRPKTDSPFDDAEQPTSLDRLIDTLGGTAVNFTLKTNCCGGHMSQISEHTGLELLRRLLKNATDTGADVMITLCPMCQLNLDMYQQAVNKQFGTDYHLPILYFTQLMGLAFGLKPAELGINTTFVDAFPALDKITADPPKPMRKKRPSKEALPMPGKIKEG